MDKAQVKEIVEFAIEKIQQLAYDDPVRCGISDILGDIEMDSKPSRIDHDLKRLEKKLALLKY